MTQEVAIKVKNVSKEFKIPHEKITSMKGAFVNVLKKNTYEEFKALDNVSFEVKKGEFFGIIGRNGSGKSTLLKILAGIYQSDSGKVEIDGLISPFLELGIGFNPELSGRDNVYLNATVLGLTKSQIDAKFNDIVEFSELERFIDQKLKNYSSGMQVRLAFSVAIHANRDILLMDEVLAVGDSNFQTKCLDYFGKIKNKGKTVILVTHDTNAVRDFCDKVLVLNDGKIEVVSPNADKAIFDYNKLIYTGRHNNKKEGSQVEKENKKNENYFEKFETLDYNKKETRVFNSGEDITIRIHLNVIEIEEGMNLGLAIFDKTTGAWICGNNTFFDKPRLEWKKGKTFVDLVFKECPLNNGTFFIRSTFFSGDPRRGKMFDYFDGQMNDFYFKVLPGKNKNGLVQLNHIWENEKN